MKFSIIIRSLPSSPVARAVTLLPQRPDSIVLVDAGPGGRSVHRPLEHVEGFVTQGKRVVYLVRQGVTLQEAGKGPGIFDYALAIIIRHEMAHVDGADEAHARREEEALWQEYVVEGRVDAYRGLKYLKLLQARRYPLRLVPPRAVCAARFSTSA